MWSLIRDSEMDLLGLSDICFSDKASYDEIEEPSDAKVGTIACLM